MFLLREMKLLWYLPRKSKISFISLFPSSFVSDVTTDIDKQNVNIMTILDDAYILHAKSRFQPTPPNGFIDVVIRIDATCVWFGAFKILSSAATIYQRDQWMPVAT